MVSGMTLKGSNLYAQSEYEIIFQHANKNNNDQKIGTIKQNQQHLNDSLH